jgi:hypothetical protein
VVPTSIDEQELCVNGMSFSCVSCLLVRASHIAVVQIVRMPGYFIYTITLFACRRRQSKWANAALVVGTDASDWAHLEPQHGVLAGVALQQTAERLETALHDAFCCVDDPTTMRWCLPVADNSLSCRAAAAMGGGRLVCPVQRVTGKYALQMVQFTLF